MSKSITDYEIIDHGIDHAQYFPGCGVSLTKYTDVATGCGTDYAEALDDALESLAQADWETSTIEPEEHDDAEVTEEHGDEAYYYVSVRVRGEKDELGCDDEPEEGDYVTEDHIRWYEHGTGKLLLTTDEDDDYRDRIKAHMEREQYWPNAWFISDHGNAHIITL